MSEAVNEVLSTFEMFFSEYRAAVEMMRQQFTTVITDKSIPLNERWELFKKAPTELKETTCWVVNFNTLNEAEGGHVSWYDMFGVDRHQTVEMLDIIERLEEIIEYGQTKIKAKQFFIDNPAKLDDLKEEILSMNLQSFVYDW